MNGGQADASAGLALVTGAGGFIGSHLVEHLRQEGVPVRAADLAHVDLTWARELGCETVALDLAQPDDVAAILEDVSVVYHVAAIFDFSSPWEALRPVNVEGAGQLTEAAAARGVWRLVLFSSVGVYGKPALEPVGEDGPKRPRNPYERSKWEGEQAVMEAARGNGLEVVALRPTMVYGPRSRFGHAAVIAFLSTRATARTPRPVPVLNGGPNMHSVHVEDVARAAYFVARHGTPGEAYNVADRTPVPLGTFEEIVMQGVGLPVRSRWPYRPRMFRALVALSKLLVRPFIPGLDAGLRRAWERRVRAQGLAPAIQLRFDETWFDYMGASHSFDVGKLEQLGFSWRQPDVRVAMPRTIRWYHEQRWIPAPGDLSTAAVAMPPGKARRL